MSELKAKHVVDVYDEYSANPYKEAQVYHKSEADKVIAELKRQIEFLKVTTDSCKNCAQCADGMGKVFDKEFNPLKDKLRREKYKRCLAIADGCQDKIKYWHIRYTIAAGYDKSYEKWKHRLFIKWRNRWLAIAEKFKEAK